ncbi:asparagine synthase (glutamine-hydrolyzing) [Geminicoccus flavidas]|uniref:asparagine synthase (glutamine-hydrolyzing) n=1 Tax=Geminicoccus flavidas TaxID=2506407 RepID=UPI00135B4DB1|nr:asparagine synthase (glutamine-hydrolyzing) [Geminicoccus flavidas]
MCGIAGVLTLPGGECPDPSLLARMTDTILHRGPDGQGHHVDPPVLMGMRRLSIIDVAGGQQPIGNEDGSVQVVFNGEIYNYRELRAELERQGHRFRTASDTEVLVHLYEQHGDAFPSYLNGMFAFALHDRTRQRVLLARDQIGIKPLFVARLPGQLVFGSEIKALLASGLVPRELDHDALAEFMCWEYVPAPRTLFRAVRKLEPGCTLAVDLHSGEIVERRFFDLPPADAVEHRSETEWADRLDAVLGQAVRRQMVADVPLGALLSGGVDSSMVVAKMGRDALTFSIGFDDSSYDELPHARRVAEALGVRHEVEVIRPDVRTLFDHLMQFMDDPIADFSIFPTYLVSRLARRHVTVALSGDGGDELFGGYDTYVAQGMAKRWQRLPAALRSGVVAPILDRIPPRPQKKGLINKAKRFVEGARLDPALGHARWRLFLESALRSRLFTGAMTERQTQQPEAHIHRYMEEAEGRDAVDRALHVDMKSYLVDNCLVKVDRMSMACSLEVRVPLLDLEVVDLAFRMPSSLKLRDGETKPLLKEVTARHVPRESVYRTKQGFSIPIKHWLNDTFRELTDELLAPERLRADGLFQAGTVESLLTEHRANRANHSHIIWAMLVFQDWQRRWGVSL